MNKKILGIFISLLVVALLATPVLAQPTNGPNKVAVSVDMTRTDGPGPGTLLDPNVNTGPITHGHWLQHFTTTVTFEDGSTLEGTIDIERKVVIVRRTPGNKLIFTDYNVFTFPGYDPDTGFVGNSKVILDIGKGLSLAYGLFHGTGDFEGQTLNIGHTWADYAAAVNPWYGYWLNR
jgi:hypothetical protein